MAKASASGVQSLRHKGYVRQDASRRYTLGPRLIRLGESTARAPKPSPIWPGLVAAIGETADMAVLEGDAVVYVAQAVEQLALGLQP